MKSFCIKNQNRKNEEGSALFYILIGVVLFAALSYTVAGMMRSGNADMIGEEQANLAAGEILDYARAMRQSVQQMKISNGCNDTDISFENSIVSGYTNGTNTSCQVFHSNGGGMNYVAPSEKWLDASQSSEMRYGEWFIPQHGCVIGVGNNPGNSNGDCASTAEQAELTLHMPFIKREICLAIIDKLGSAAQSSGNPYKDFNNTWGGSRPKFTGTYASNTGIDRAELSGELAGCYEGFSSSSNPPEGSYNFFQVLIAR